MTLAQAQEIMHICYQHVLFCKEVITDPPPSLENYTLYELLEAKRVVEESGIETMRCHERGLAALYVAYHFPGDDPENCEFIAIAADRRAVVVVKPQW